MQHFAEVVSVLTYPHVPENIMPFVIYKAKLENITLENGLKIILLRVIGTNSYYVIFPQKTSMEKCKQELKEAGISINKRTELFLSKYIV